MNLRDFFQERKASTDKLPPSLSVPGAIDEHARIGCLDFVAAIEAHRKWKARLTDFIEGRSEETLDPAVICQDDKCALGKWIHGEGKTFCGHLPRFHQLKADHAEFHIHAAEVVRLAQKGHSVQAMKYALEGPFSEYSLKTQFSLSRLYAEMSQSLSFAVKP